MYPGQLSYLPLALPSFSLLVVAFLILASLLYVEVLGYAYTRIGLSPGAAVLVLIGSLVGSYFNIPVADVGGHRVVSGALVSYYGMQYVVPVVVHWPGTIIAVNVGGALIPGAISLYLFFKHRLWIRGPLAVAAVGLLTHALAHPVRGIGIAVPVFVPALATAVVAVMVSPRQPAPLAYIGGSVGTLAGADLLNLGRIGELGAPVASIGGAGTFDGVFLTGILAVLLASLWRWGNGEDSHPRAAPPPPRQFEDSPWNRSATRSAAKPALDQEETAGLRRELLRRRPADDRRSLAKRPGAAENGALRGGRARRGSSCPLRLPSFRRLSGGCRA